MYSNRPGGKGFEAEIEVILYIVGFFIGWPVMLFLMAERLRNLGKFTFVDIISDRLDPVSTRCVAAGSSLVVVLLYLIVQMVGAGELVQLLFGIDYAYAVVGVGALMMIYVTVGGMVATTWVQIIKAVLLMFGGSLLMLLSLAVLFDGVPGRQGAGGPVVAGYAARAAQRHLRRDESRTGFPPPH